MKKKMNEKKYSKKYVSLFSITMLHIYYIELKILQFLQAYLQSKYAARKSPPTVCFFFVFIYTKNPYKNYILYKNLKIIIINEKGGGEESRFLLLSQLALHLFSQQFSRQHELLQVYDSMNFRLKERAYHATVCFNYYLLVM